MAALAENVQRPTEAHPWIAFAPRHGAVARECRHGLGSLHITEPVPDQRDYRLHRFMSIGLKEPLGPVVALEDGSGDLADGSDRTMEAKEDLRSRPVAGLRDRDRWMNSFAGDKGASLPIEETGRPCEL